jgi:acyl-coenzyme A thioesterase 9
MRALSTPWLSLKDPELAALGAATSRKHTEDGAGGIDGDVLTEAQLEELMRPRYMSESYTTFDLPLASDKSLFERYVDTTGSPREFY